MENSLEMAPFPPLTWKESYWESSIILPAFAGFQSRLGSYYSQSSSELSDGMVNLNIATPDDKKMAPFSEQAIAFQKLIEKQNIVRDSILQSLFSEYPKWKQEWGLDEFMPDVEEPNQLKLLMGLSAFHISTDVKDGLAYIGFDFGCNWDPDHGFAAMTHGTRVVQIGDAAVAWDTKDSQANS